MDDLELEILPPTGNDGDGEVSFDNGGFPRPLLNPEKLKSQSFVEKDGFLSTPGKNSAQKKERLQELAEEARATSSVRPKEKILKDYNVMLNLTDVEYGVKGHNKYYKIQIIQASDGFVLYTQWGRVGAKNPQSKRDEYGSKIEAIKAFKKKFSDKTWNDWDDRDNFQPQSGKYTMISVADGGIGGEDSINKEIQKLNKRNQEIKMKIETKPSNLESRLFELMRMIWDINRMNKTLRELNFDTERYPLGRLTSEQIQKGYKILSEIQNVLQHDGKQSKLIELTNEFYTNIPQNFGMRKPPMIDNTSALKDKVMLLDALKELDVANKYINLALFKKGAEDINPLDSFFSLLNIRINRIDSSDNMYTIIQNCLRVSHGPTHDKYALSIIDLFEVQRNGENERFWPFRRLNNRALLWHGSRVTNFVGILSEGLKIAPPDAPVTGYMFGKGIYFADVPSKSANYCHATPESPEGLLLLCEVALGDTYRVYKPKGFKRAPKYFHSVYGVGKKRPVAENKIYLGDFALECGEVKDNKELENPETGRIESDLMYNEFIVYDVGQVYLFFTIA